MSIASWFFVLTGVLLNAVAQLCLKAATNATGPLNLSAGHAVASMTRLAAAPPLWAGLALYGVSVIVWIAALYRTPVSVAYPMLSIGYIVNAFAAYYLFHEPITATKGAGIVVICAGVYLLARG
jgi:multidrug transporter EmrE-like cation transporter